MKSYRVLIVEDNAILREMTSRRLARRGYVILVAEDGERGLDIIRAEKPDIVLLDMSLPGMDGWAVASHIKADNNICQIPVIALTAHAMRGDRERTLRAGCDDYVSKPIDFELLTEKMHILLGESD